MNYEGNLAEQLPLPKEHKTEDVILKKDIQGTKEYYEHLSAWEPDKLTAEDRKNWELLKNAEEPFTDMQKARLSGLRKKQLNFGADEGFTPDEVMEFDFLTSQEEKEKRV